MKGLLEIHVEGKKIKASDGRCEGKPKNVSHSIRTCHSSAIIKTINANDDDIAKNQKPLFGISGVSISKFRSKLFEKNQLSEV